MRRIVFLVVALTMLFALPSVAGRLTATPLVHTNQVYQACVCPCDLTPAGSSQIVTDNFGCYLWRGYLPQGPNVISAVPGVLAFDPGGYDWPNFVAAAQAGVPWTIKNVTLVKETPEYVQCRGFFPPHTVTQQGTANIRKWWPLMYEVPSTTYTLTILYGTPNLFDDDGIGPNPPAWVHVEQWVWHVHTDLPHLSLLLELFHELPFGKDEVPLISDEPLYCELQYKIAQAIVAYNAGDTATAAAWLADFELEVMDACICCSPAFPNPFGFGTGIANSQENPACCKLLVDVEYILQTTGIGQPAK